MRNAHLAAAALTAMALTACQMVQTPQQQWDNHPALLDDACARIESAANALETDMRAAADKLSVPGAAADKNLIRESLSALAKKNPTAYDVSFVDKSGRMLVVEPSNHSNYEGADISSQEQVRKVLDQGVTALSPLFLAVEGFHALDIEVPVKDADGHVLGAVSVLLRPEEFLGGILAPMAAGSPADIWMMDSTGVLLYDQDTAEIGRHSLTDRLYRPFPSLIAAAQTILSGPENGFVRYDFLNHGLKQKMRKLAFWRKIKLHGVEWIVVVSVSANPDLTSLNWPRSPWAPSEDDALRLLAESPALLKAVESGESSAILSALKSHSLDYPRHSLQWIAGKNRIVCGYPPRDSRTGFDLSAEKNPSDLKLIQSLAEGKESIFEDRLLEGGRGRFHLVPVRKDGEVVGSLLAIDLLTPRQR